MSNTIPLGVYGGWKEVTASPIRTFHLQGEPELMHIIKLNNNETYAMFREDPFGQEPWQSGMKVVNKSYLKAMYNIDL